MKLGKKSIFVAMAVGLFLLYAIVPLGQAKSGNTPKFDTPDETIHYSFATHLANTGSLVFVEPLNATFTNPIIFMRWMQSPGVGSDKLFPGTFLGFIFLAAGAAKLLGSWAALFITPILGIGSVFLMYWGTRTVFGKSVAMWSAIILALLPPFFYYASRSMFHTVPFLFFILLGVAAYLHIHQSRYPWWFVLLASFGFGGALFIRFADIWWIGLTVLTLLVAHPIGWKKTAVLALMMIGSILGNVSMYHAIYGSWFTFGYPIPGFSASDATVTAPSFWRFILPFGFRPNLMWHAAVETVLRPYAGFLVVCILGFIAMAIRFWDTQRRAIIILFFYLLGSTFYVLSLYGSWSFSDSPTPGLVTIGSSYTRYFLPLLVLRVPFAGYLIAKGISFLQKKQWRVAAAMFVVILFVLQTWSMAWASDEGLAHVMAQTRAYQMITQDLKKSGATAHDIFLVHRGEDKILFPDFLRVINIDYLPEEMVRKNLEQYPGTVWVSSGDHVFTKHNPFRK